MINILYTGRNLRVRRRETIQNPPDHVRYTTQFSINEMPPDHKLTGRIKVNYKELILLKIVSILQIPNIRHLPKSMLQGIDLIHTPGQILINKQPYVVEIDNVGCLSFYKLSTLFGFIGKRIITFFLKRNNCKKILCISEAAKYSIINFFQDSIITNKCVVSYPFVSDKHLNSNNISVSDIPKLLYISSDFYLKGGKELIQAYISLKNKKIPVSLTIITKIANITPEDLTLISQTDINLVEANINKESLYNDYYLKHDIFVCPTYKDSFGLVFLEALSCGLAIIATNMFAVKEMVISGYNGQVLQPPLSVFTENYLPNPQRRDTDIGNYVIKNPSVFQNFQKELEISIEDLVSNKEKLLTYKKNSLKIFQEKFHNIVRTKHLKEIYLASLK